MRSLLLGLVAYALGAQDFNAPAAAAYLDQRAAWWMGWKPAARDHETFCISCHTALPYALGRSSLRTALGEAGPSANERQLLENVTKRVKLWSEVEPFYNDEKSGPAKSVESRGTEAVLNALILASYQDGWARQALRNMWAQQLDSGEFPWLNFHNEPWEADDSQYWGATLAAIAAGSMPQEYRSDPDIRDKLKSLTGYLQRKEPGQSLLNRTTLLWASTKLPGLLAPNQQKSIVDELFSRQLEDGGWSASTLIPATWKRRDATALETKSDGYATGLVSLVLRSAGVSREQQQLKRGLTWLARQQDPAGGFWPGYSLNKRRDPASDAGRFMSDAATAYSVLALTR